MKNFFYLLILGLFSCSDGNLPFYEPSNNDKALKNVELPFLGRETIEGKYKVPDFNGITHLNDSLTQVDLKGKPYVAEFFYVSCPSICPLVKSQLIKIYKDEAFSKLRFVSFTLAPEQDTPKVLKQYATDLEILSDRWTFVNVDFEEIYKLANGYLIAAVPERTDDGEIPHDGRIVLVDENGHLRATCQATDREAVKKFKVQVKNYLNK